MVNETKQKWQRLAVTGSTQPSSTQQPTFEAKDLESVSGKFHTVCCLDVLIHYPQVTFSINGTHAQSHGTICFSVSLWTMLPAILLLLEF